MTVSEGTTTTQSLPGSGRSRRAAVICVDTAACRPRVCVRARWCLAVQQRGGAPLRTMPCRAVRSATTNGRGAPLQGPSPS